MVRVASAARPMNGAAGALAILLPPVHAAPMHDQRRLRPPGGDLQITDELLALERDLDDLQRGIEMFGCLAKNAQGVLVGFLLIDGARHGIAGDPAILERERIERCQLARVGVLAGTRVGICLVGEADPAPQLRPLIRIQACKRSNDLRGILPANPLERGDMAGTTSFFISSSERSCAAACGTVAMESDAATPAANRPVVFMGHAPQTISV